MDDTNSFPEGVTPPNPQGKLDPTCLVWDFSASDQEENTKDGSYVKVYLRPEESGDKTENDHQGANVTNCEAPAADTDTGEDTTKSPSAEKDDDAVESSMLQYQRQLRKTQAAKKAGAILKDEQLEVVFEDEGLVVVNKPAGVLCVPGINNNDSIASLLFARLEKQKSDRCEDLCPDACSMAIHRLDMDTSGLVAFGKTKSTVSILHKVFRGETDQPKKKRKRKRKKHPKPGEEDNELAEEQPPEPEPLPAIVVKEYEALVCGHIPAHITSGHVDLPLQRDIHHPPFMRVSTPHSEALARQVVDALRERNWTKLSKRNPKPSQTKFRVVQREYLKGNDLPVTRLSLTPITGRTHQLRVHCAALGFPIVGDPVYGLYGESAFNAGLHHNKVQVNGWERADGDWRAPVSLQMRIMEEHPPNDKPMCLHAKKLGFAHPKTRVMTEWEVAPKF